MREVDARGLSCPEPIMLTNMAMKESDEPFKVLVSEPHQKTNVEKLVKSKGRKCHFEENGAGFVITVE